MPINPHKWSSMVIYIGMQCNLDSMISFDITGFYLKCMNKEVIKSAQLK
jgi:hypothetical protein